MHGSVSRQKGGEESQGPPPHKPRLETLSEAVAEFPLQLLALLSEGSASEQGLPVPQRKTEPERKCKVLLGSKAKNPGLAHPPVIGTGGVLVNFGVGIFLS